MFDSDETAGIGKWVIKHSENYEQHSENYESLTLY